MSYREEKTFALAAIEYQDKSLEELKFYYKETLKSGMHGLCFSAYLENQQPGDQLSEAQIRQRIEVIKPYTNWIRTFSCTEGNELIPKIAKEYGIKTLVGAWLGEDKAKNDLEITNLITAVNKGYVDIAAVGNEVMYRGDLSEEELLNYIHLTKQEIKNKVPVGYADAYYEFEDRPAITALCDVILANCYPFWEGCDLDYSLLYMKDMYNRALKAGNGKKVIVSETGWPNKGSKLEGAHPSEENAIKYFINSQKWSKNEDIEMFYFSSFDESWKIGTEGDVGAFWGIWNKDGKLKF